MFLNLVVFILWSVLPAEVMMMNFTVSWDLLMQSRYWTLVTAAFSHNWFIHFLINMLVLRSFGSLIEVSIGSMNFVRFYLMAAVVSSLTHSVVSASFLDSPHMGALGASGPIAGVVLLFAFMYPREKILLFGIIPIPALLGSLIFVGLDLWGLIAQAEGGGLPIGHGAHLGGALAGVLYYFLKVRPHARSRY
jgi:membrane associated rhomboid family serine protease